MMSVMWGVLCGLAPLPLAGGTPIKTEPIYFSTVTENTEPPKISLEEIFGWWNGADPFLHLPFRGVDYSFFWDSEEGRVVAFGWPDPNAVVADELVGSRDLTDLSASLMIGPDLDDGMPPPVIRFQTSGYDLVVIVDEVPDDGERQEIIILFGEDGTVTTSGICCVWTSATCSCWGKGPAGTCTTDNCDNAEKCNPSSPDRACKWIPGTKQKTCGQGCIPQ